MKAIEVQNKFQMDEVGIVSYCSASDEELTKVLNWRNDPAIRTLMFTTEEISVEDHFSFSRGLADREDRFYFVVSWKGEAVGAVAITDIDYRNKSAYLGIYAKPNGAPKGAGCTLMHVICKIVFDIMQFNSLKLQVLSSNERAHRFYKKFGFVEEGRLCEACLRGDKYEDVIVMGILAREYREIYG